MPGAPLDLAETLPDDWIERPLALRPSIPTAPVLSLLQDVVRVQRERAIGLQRVQEAAQWLTRRAAEGEATLFPWLNALMERLTPVAGGTWPIETAVAERRPDSARKHLLNVADDVDAIIAELAVLDALAQRGARPVPRQRAPRGFDWIVERETRALPVEVKQKASLGAMGHRMQWFWKGVSLLPRGAFIRNYTWYWHVREQARADDARQMMDALWAGAAELQEALPRGGSQHKAPSRSSQGGTAGFGRSLLLNAAP